MFSIVGPHQHNFLSPTRQQQQFSYIRQVFNQLQSFAIFFLENDPRARKIPTTKRSIHWQLKDWLLWSRVFVV